MKAYRAEKKNVGSSARILIPILGFAAQGGYRVLSELANAWQKNGHECTFLIPSTSAEPYFPTDARILRCNRKGEIPAAQTSKIPTGRDNILSLLAGLRRIAKDYDIIIANHSLTAWPVFLADSGNAKKIYYIQAYEPSYYPILKDPIKHLLAKGSYLLGLCQIANGSTYSGWGLNPQAIIPPGIDLSIFSLKESELTPEGKSTVTLGTIGRTEPYKGTETALKAYRLLRQSNSKLQMKVGFGNVKTADDIEVVPIRGDNELAAFYRSVDILVVSCRGQHGAPHYPLIEAMASGTPVVHTGYYPGDKKNSWQARDSTVEAVADAIQQLIDTPEAEKSARVESARETVAINLSWDAVAQQFEVFFYD